MRGDSEHPRADGMRHDRSRWRADIGVDGGIAIAILLFASLDMAGWVENPSIARFLIRATWWILYVAVAIRLVQRFGIDWIVWLIRRQVLLGLLLALAVASSLWSLAPLESLHTSVSLMATTLLGVYIGYVLPTPVMTRTLSIVFACVMWPSLAALPVLPSAIVIEPATGQWRGLMDHKNTFGAMAAVALLFYVAAIVRRRGVSLWPIAMSVACLLALLLSRSVTSLMACGVGIGAVGWFVAAQRGWLSSRRARRRLLLVSGAGVALAIYSFGPIAGALGRDAATLNGRTPLWWASLRIIRERPLTGYGYHVVWWKQAGTLLPHIPETAGWQAASAHNALLNTATELGLPAAALLAAYLVGMFLDALRFEQRHRSPLSLFVVTALLAVATLSIAESYLLAIHSVLWILIVAIAVMLRRSSDAGPQAAHSGWTP